MSNFDDGNFTGSSGDTFTEVTSRSWFSRIGSSLTGMLIGPLVVLIAIGLLFWNEGRAVGTARSLSEGAGRVVSIAASPVDAANDGKLVHVAGPIAVPGRLRDAAFGIEAEGLRLVRKVEVFQWKETSHSETRKKLGGGEETVTTYHYALDWTDHPVDGSSFKQPDGHRNPPVNVRGESFAQPRATLGAFALTPSQIGGLGETRTRPVTGSDEGAVRRAAGGATALSVLDGRIHLGFDPMRPRLGDVRISYEVAQTPEATIVARQAGNGLAAFTTSNGRTIEILRNGRVPAEQVFADAQTENTILTWIIRVGGILLLALGFGMLLGPLSVLADVIPFLGSLIGGVSSMVAFALAVLVGSITIAIAWFAYRPLLSIGLIVAGVAIAYGLRKLGGRKAAAPAAAGA